MKNTSLVTIGIALYNHENYIQECLTSLFAQTYEDIEIIVIDDGSKDNSYEVAKSVCESQDRFPCIVKTRPNQGMCNTLNEIAHLARGEYISFIGSDDFWHPEKIAKQVEFLNTHPHLALVHANSWVVDEKSAVYSELNYSNKVNSGRLFEAIVTGKGWINTPCHLYRTSVYETLGYYDPQFRFEDTDFWLRLTNVFEVGFLDEKLSYYRIHKNNMSKGDNLLSFYNDEIVKIYKKNIADDLLLQTALLRMYRKSFLRALRGLKIGYFLKYTSLYLQCRYGRSCR